MTKLEKAIKTLGAETLNEMNAESQIQLRERVVAADEAMRSVAQELDDNEAYQELKANKSAMEAGKRDVDKRQKAIILLALNLINEGGTK